MELINFIWNWPKLVLTQAIKFQFWNQEAVLVQFLVYCLSDEFNPFILITE